MLKVLFTASIYDYATPDLGKSFEYYNFYDTLRHMAKIKIKLFDWVTLSKKYGKEKMNEMLYENVKEEKPDLVFFSVFRDEFDKQVIQEITNEGDTITFNMFTNDLWRFKEYSKYWAPCFTWVSTDEATFVPKYLKIGYKNVIMGHWGFNPRIYKKLNLPYKYDVSFVGQAYSNRKGIVRVLRKNRINIAPFGQGFKPGKISFSEMIRVFNQSKINLNLSEHSKKYEFLRFFPTLLQPARIDVNAFQLKARIFEVVGCGGFLLTTYGDRLKEYFHLGKEIETYSDFDDLVEKARYYLENDREREKIAEAGYKRVIRDHTYKRRFIKIFKKIGLLD